MRTWKIGFRPTTGRPSIPPERLLQAFYTIRSETQLTEQLDYNLLYRWSVGLGVDEPGWCQRCSRRTATGCWKPRSGRASGPQRGARFAIQGALLFRWRADCHVGVDEELPGEDGIERAALSGSQRRAGFPRREAQQRDTRLDHRPRSQALPEWQRQGGEALLHRQRDDGERHRLVVEAELGGASGTIEREAAKTMAVGASASMAHTSIVLASRAA